MALQAKHIGVGSARFDRLDKRAHLLYCVEHRLGDVAVEGAVRLDEDGVGAGRLRLADGQDARAGRFRRCVDNGVAVVDDQRLLRQARVSSPLDSDSERRDEDASDAHT